MAPRLTREQRQALLDQIAADDEAAAGEEDYDVQIWDDAGNGAQVRYSKARSWLQKTFGIDLDPDPAGDPEGDDDGKAKPGQRKPAAGTDGVVRFGRRVS